MPTILVKKEEQKYQSSQKGKTNTSQFLKRHVAILAFLIFISLNLVLFKLEKQNHTSADLWRGTGSIDLTINSFKQLKQSPKLVLLGSSLVMFPFWSLDKSLYPKSVGDMFHHHGSMFLENRLESQGLGKQSVFSFAIFGQMVSDAYIYVDEFLKDKYSPEILVYGIAPRDFSDYDLSSPMATNTFKRLVDLSNFARYANLYLPGFQDKVEFLFSRLCYFYDHRWRLQQEVNKAIAKVWTALGIVAPEPPKLNFDNAGFMVYGATKARWDSSEQEYTRRYKNIADRDLNVQVGFLTRLLELAEKRHIKVIILNMPLSDVNRNLLPKGFYDQFRQKIASLSNKPNVRFLDLGSDNEFTHEDYWDTAHLGPSGGEKLVKKLEPVVVELQAQKLF